MTWYGVKPCGPLSWRSVRSALVGGVICAIAVAAPLAMADAEPVLIRFSHVTSDTSPKGVGAIRFKELAEQRLAGKVRVEIYPNATRYDDEHAILGLLLGEIEMAAPSLSKFRSISRKIQLFDLPFLFNDIDHLKRFQNSQAGVVFRIEPSNVFASVYEQLGAVPIAMPFRLARDASINGLVGGHENVWTNISSKRLTDYHPNVLEMEHSFLGYMLITQTEFWNKLPADVREELDKIIAEVTQEVNRLAKERNAAVRERIVGSGKVKVYRPSESERSNWQAALEGVHERFADQIGRDLIDEVIKAGGQPN